MSLSDLELIFIEAIYKSAKYIAVEIESAGMPENEIIINKNNAILEKLLYYKKAYNEDLTLKANSGIKIVKAMYCNDFSEIEEALC